MNGTQQRTAHPPVPPGAKIVPATRLTEQIPVLVDEDFEYTHGLHVNAHGYVGFWDAEAGRGELLHRRILGLVPGDGQVGDHRNRDRLDNRRSNLRAVDDDASNGNRAGWSSAGVRGVQRMPNGRFRVQVCAHKRRQHLGCFETLEEAAAVAVEWRRQNLDEYVETGASA